MSDKSKLVSMHFYDESSNSEIFEYETSSGINYFVGDQVVLDKHIQGYVVRSIPVIKGTVSKVEKEIEVRVIKGAEYVEETIHIYIKS